MTTLILAAFALSACGGALNVQDLKIKDSGTFQALLTESANITLSPTVQTTGTPEGKGQGGGESTEVPETKAAETDAPKTEQPHACKTPDVTHTPGTNDSHEVLGQVTNITLGTNGFIVIGGVTYFLTSQSVIHDPIQINDWVRLTFGFSDTCQLIVHEVKVTNQNGSSNGNGNGGNNSHKGGGQATPTP